MYHDLVNDLENARKELADFDEKYPDLSIDYIFPESLVVNRLSDYTRGVSQEHHEETAYLDFDELADIYGVSTGSFHSKHAQFGITRAYLQIEKAQERFTEELDLLCQRYKSELKYLALKISGATATNTARLIDGRSCLLDNIAKAQQRLERYYKQRCTRFRVSKELDISIYYTTNDVPKAAGIYFLLQESEIVYVGRSTNISKRLKNHDVVRKYYSKNTNGGYNIVCGIYESKEVLSELEKSLIRTAQPKYNLQSKDF